MTLITAVAAATALLRGSPKLVMGAAVVLSWMVNPVLGVAAGVAIVIRAVVRRRERPAVRTGDDALLADLTVLGLSAGLTFTEAASAAADTVGGAVSTRLVRSIRFRGSNEETPADDPALMVVARRALSTGAPLIPAVSGFASTLRDEERARQLTAARRLPVKLLFPLALLILPGFLILTIGPAVLGSLERLGF